MYINPNYPPSGSYPGGQCPSCGRCQHCGQRTSPYQYPPYVTSGYAQTLEGQSQSISNNGGIGLEQFNAVPFQQTTILLNKPLSGKKQD